MTYVTQKDDFCHPLEKEVTSYLPSLKETIMKNHLYLSIALWMLIPTMMVAQLTISGEVRPRAEYRHGFKSLPNQNQEAAFFIDQLFGGELKLY